MGGPSSGGGRSAVIALGLMGVGGREVVGIHAAGRGGQRGRSVRVLFLIFSEPPGSRFLDGGRRTD